MKDATQIKAKAGSLKGRIWSIISNFLGFGASLDLTVKLAMMSIPKSMNAAALIVHGNPILGISFVTIIGMTTPPKEDPEAMMPNAVARFLKNQVPMEFMAA
jgi:hypothetical protein